MRTGEFGRHGRGAAQTTAPTDRGIRCARSAVLILVAWIAWGCTDRTLAPLNPCTLSAVNETVNVRSVEKVDLLFVIDNSTTMEEEQALLGQEVPRLARILASGDLDGDDAPDFSPVRDLHVGVVSSDMGTGGVTVPDFDPPACNDAPEFGDDGLLQHTGRSPSCPETIPSFLSFIPGEPPDPTQTDVFVRDFTCISQLGDGGCNFEQPLEAALKALTPSGCDEPWCTFFRDTRGHGDGANAGFLRPDSLLVVLVLTDEDDCSLKDPGLLDADNPTYSSQVLNVRCGVFPEALHDIARYRDGFLALREAPGLLVFSAIAGIPPDLVDVPLEAALQDPRMRPRLQPPVREGEPSLALQISCGVGEGVCNQGDKRCAEPPHRIAELASELEAAGASTSLQTICSEDFAPALDGVVAKIAGALGAPCLPRALARSSGGTVRCDVVEILPTEGAVTRCEQAAERGRSLTRVEGGREVCRISQVPVVGGGLEEGRIGWFYDDFTEDMKRSCGADGQRISFTVGSEPTTGSVVRLECLQTVRADGISNAIARVGSSCAEGSEPRCAPAGLICEPLSKTCQKTCRADADCASLGGFFCDEERSPAVCVNPLCLTPI